mmetsp:Transcript_577/g.1640  ORF Transcript_577/g.1640 Transcript_577/m.1640 type:complete len:205 (+) Transcript_577:44-658(+)
MQRWSMICSRRPRTTGEVRRIYLGLLQQRAVPRSLCMGQPWAVQSRHREGGCSLYGCSQRALAHWNHRKLGRSTEEDQLASSDEGQADCVHRPRIPSRSRRHPRHAWCRTKSRKLSPPQDWRKIDPRHRHHMERIEPHAADLCELHLGQDMVRCHRHQPDPARETRMPPPRSSGGARTWRRHHSIRIHRQYRRQHRRWHCCRSR